MPDSLPPSAPPFLAGDFAAYSDWRNRLRERIAEFRSQLDALGVGDDESRRVLDAAMSRLDDDTLNIAFVAEFSRGKSELINAIFFADYRRRMLPSSAGRTTMCPTELMWTPARPASLRLLPIATRNEEGSLADFKGRDDAWTVFPLDLDSPESMAATLQHLADTETVDLETATRFGLVDPEDEEATQLLVHDGKVAIPRWRHAQVNIPHPLLEQGLVILDTPGLNAIGAEPELTLNLLPAAHAVLFLLGADTGTTRSDLDIWREFTAQSGSSGSGRLVALNKIDSLWDDLKLDDEIDADIARQCADCAQQLDVPPERVFPVSAQKALVAKVRGDAGLLTRSRLPQLEAALSQELLPAKRRLVADATLAGVDDVAETCTELLESRLAALQDQHDELTGLRGKNRDAIAALKERAESERLAFGQCVTRFNAVKSVYANHARRLRRHLSGATLRELSRKTRETMNETLFSVGLVDAMRLYFAEVNGHLARSSAIIAELHTMMQAMYQRFAEDYGLTVPATPRLGLGRYQVEMQRLENIFNLRFNTPVKLLTLEKRLLTRQFFDSVASKIGQVFTVAGRETEGWMKALLAPMHIQIEERRSQLDQRIDSIARVDAASEQLVARIAELEAELDAAGARLDALARAVTAVREVAEIDAAA